MSDAINELLCATRVRGSLYFSTEFTAPWGVRVPEYKQVARFHYVARGRCWAHVEGAEREGPFELMEGDLIVIPFGRSHRLADVPERQVLELDTAVEDSGFKGVGTFVLGSADGGAATRMLCGHFEYDEPLISRILRQMPPAVILRRNEIGDAFWLQEGLRFLSDEKEQARPGRQAMAQKISELVFIELLRRFAEKDPAGSRIFAAAQDARISRALEAIHKRTSERWTVEDLAGEAGMSRTAFAEKFEMLMGVPPIEYLNELRMSMARQMLVETHEPIQSIARRLGYESDPGFSRAFSRIVGESPSAYRAKATRR